MRESRPLTIRSILLLVCFVSSVLAAPAGDNLLENGGFEQGMKGWNALWTRTKGVGKAVLDKDARHGGTQAVRIEHPGDKDWSLGHDLRLKVRPGEIYELAAWVRLQGAGSASLGVVTADASGKTLSWDHGGRSIRQTKDWRQLRSRFVVPPGTATIWPRLIGNGPATVWMDDAVLTRQGTLDALRKSGLPAGVSIRNEALEIVLRTADAGFEVKDRRSGRTWSQRAEGSPFVVVDAKAVDDRTVGLKLLDPASMRELSVSARLDGVRPELSIALRGEGEMRERLAWPAPFASAKGGILVLPVNEGISYPVDDVSLPSMYYHLYGGHGLCMPWYGATNGQGAGWMAIVETADDAVVFLPRYDGLLCLAPAWQPQKGKFGPERVIRYVFFAEGGYVAMAKRYREHAKRTGLFRTLAEKRKAIPAVDQLAGAVNVWCWDPDAPAFCREMKTLGIDRILWSHRRKPGELKVLNGMGVLTSRYDIYQDAMDPKHFPRLRWIHHDWTSDAWKHDDIMIDARGDWVRGWRVKTKGGDMIPCGVLCDRQAVAYAKRRISAELKDHPYRSRFIDTTTASPWRECYHEKHPMTRTQSKKAKMDLLKYISEGAGLVCGSETGHDAAVPYVHYFEGMLSLGPYRVPDAGRQMIKVWDEVPERVAKFQTGHGYRLPLWELVYHDCVVAQWYWGDYNNKLPRLWDRRDLWNALYGTPPMFMFNRKIWESNKERFAKSYRTAATVARATGYSEMRSHEWLTTDRAVQRTRFANGVVVTVNFGGKPYTMPGGGTLAPLAMKTEGLEDE